MSIANMARWAHFSRSRYAPVAARATTHSSAPSTRRAGSLRSRALTLFEAKHYHGNY